MKISTCTAITVILTTICTRTANSANILAFNPYPAASHHRVYWPLLKELVRRGHNVTMFSPLAMPDPPTHNYTEIRIDSTSMDENMDDSAASIIKSSNELLRFLQNSVFFMNLGKSMTMKIVQDDKFQWLLRSDSKFDLIFGEWTFSQETFAVLHHRFEAINVELTSFGNFHWAYWLYGQPYDTSYIADSDSCYSDRMNFMERLQNTLQSLIVRLTWCHYFMPKYQIIMDKYVRYPGWEKRPGIIELLRNTSLVLMNTHYSLNYPYPNSPHFKEIGGINILPLQPLPKDLQLFMDKAEDGVIFFSLGSVLQAGSVLKESVQRSFVNVFKRLNQRVIWKLETTNIKDLPANIKLGSWFPQQSILAHKNCKLFISHGGFLSLTETVARGVPVVVIPMWADQLRNARQMITNGYAVQLDFNNLTEEDIYFAINLVLTDPRYKENAVKQSRIFNDKPETALETAVYWTEYVIRHKGAQHLRPAIATMPWYQQAMIDVYAAIALIIITPVYIIYKLIKCIMYKCFGNVQSKKSNTKKNQ